MANKPDNHLGKTKGRWITIGNPDRDEDEPGTHVYIDDSGTITAGPESLTNKPINRLGRRQEQPAEQEQPTSRLGQTPPGWGTLGETGATEQPASEQPTRRAVSELRAGDQFEHEGQTYTLNSYRDVARGSNPQNVRAIHLREGDYVIGPKSGRTYRVAEIEHNEDGTMGVWLDDGSGGQSHRTVRPEGMAPVATSVGHGREMDVTDTNGQSRLITLPNETQVSTGARTPSSRPSSTGLRAPTTQARETPVSRPVTDLKQGDRVQWTDGSIREIEGVTHDPNRHTVRLHFTSGRSFTLKEEAEVARIEIQQAQPEKEPSVLLSTLPKGD